MLCIHTNNSNKPSIIVDDLSVSTSHASDSEINSLVIKPVIVDTFYLDNSESFCLNNCVKLKSKKLGTHSKFVLTCHYCGKVGHIRPKCYLLKSHWPWNKQDALKKGNVEKPSSDKYVTPHRRHISQRVKDFVLCENANPKSAEPVKKHFSKRSQTTCHHYGVSGHIRPHCPKTRSQKPWIKQQEPKTGKSSSKPSKPHHASRQKQQCPQRGSPSCSHSGKNGHTKAECFKLKPDKAKEIQNYEGLVYMMKNILVNLDKFDMAYNLRMSDMFALHYLSCHILFMHCIPFEESYFLSSDFLLLSWENFYRYFMGMTEKARHCFSVLVILNLSPW
jgi:hypothetical protein